MLNWTNNSFVRVAFIILMVFCLVTTLSLQLEYNRLKVEKAALEKQITDAAENVEELTYALNTPFDHEYIIRFAREKLNYRLPEEIVFYNDLNH